jgi:hypothetical protein
MQLIDKISYFNIVNNFNIFKYKLIKIIFFITMFFIKKILIIMIIAILINEQE